METTGIRRRRSGISKGFSRDCRLCAGQQCTAGAPVVPPGSCHVLSRSWQPSNYRRYTNNCCHGYYSSMFCCNFASYCLPISKNKQANSTRLCHVSMSGRTNCVSGRLLGRQSSNGLTWLMISLVLLTLLLPSWLP